MNNTSMNIPLLASQHTHVKCPVAYLSMKLLYQIFIFINLHQRSGYELYLVQQQRKTPILLSHSSLNTEYYQTSKFLPNKSMENNTSGRRSHLHFSASNEVDFISRLAAIGVFPFQENASCCLHGFLLGQLSLPYWFVGILCRDLCSPICVVYFCSLWLEFSCYFPHFDALKFSHKI